MIDALLTIVASVIVFALTSSAITAVVLTIVSPGERRQIRRNAERAQALINGAVVETSPTVRCSQLTEYDWEAVQDMLWPVCAVEAGDPYAPGGLKWGAGRRVTAIETASN